MLFGDYLAFYGRSWSESEAGAYLADRMDRGESIVQVAEAGSGLVGFTQCYPTWSSLDLAPMWMLEDLFVAESARRAGVARALMDGAIAAASAAGACRVALETQHHNSPAIALYTSLGFTRDTEFALYALELGDA